MYEEIRAFLAAETEAEPVAYGYKDRWNDISACISRQSAKDAGTQGDFTIPLYTRPEPEAEPVRNNAFDDEICPVCGYYCNGKGGFGCIDKPVLTGLRKPPKPAEPEPANPEDLATIAYQFGYQEGKRSRPEPARKPMTEEELEKLFRECHGNFEKVVRAIERHHGIGGDDE